jgi:hypothetical protein
VDPICSLISFRTKKIHGVVTCSSTPHNEIGKIF